MELLELAQATDAAWRTYEAAAAVRGTLSVAVQDDPALDATYQMSREAASAAFRAYDTLAAAYEQAKRA